MPIIQFNHWLARAPLQRVPNTTEQLVDDVVYRQAFISGDRVRETTATTGTGPIALLGAVSGYQAFAAVAVLGDSVAYAVTGTTEWEVGIGTFASNALQRTTVLASSNAGALVSFSAGSKGVFNQLPGSHGTMPVISRLQVIDMFVPRDTTTYSPDDYEISAGFALELDVSAGMEIG